MDQPEDTDALVRFENITYSYPYSDSRVLSDVNLKLEKGEFVLLAGPSGCGKVLLSAVLTAGARDFWRKTFRACHYSGKRPQGGKSP